jgi:signal transduction histidine kinase
MLNSLLDWAKAELLIKENVNQSINAHEFIEDNIKEFIIKLSDKNITVLNLIPVNQKINFNDSVLKIVFRNIINNAIKFSYENSEIKIIWHPNTIEILDSGKGIESEKLKKLFKKNINPGLGTNMETGFGLGLYLSSELMLKNGGKISAKSNDEGTSFYIHFSN